MHFGEPLYITSSPFSKLCLPTPPSIHPSLLPYLVFGQYVYPTTHSYFLSRPDFQQKRNSLAPDAISVRHNMKPASITASKSLRRRKSTSSSAGALRLLSPTQRQDSSAPNETLQQLPPSLMGRSSDQWAALRFEGGSENSIE